MAEKKQAKNVSKKINVATKEEKVEVVKTKNQKNSFWKENSTNVLVAVLCLLLVGNIILVVVGHKVKLKDGKEVIATIEGRDYTAEEVFDGLKSKYGSDILINLVDAEIADKELSDGEKNEAKTEAKDYIQSIKAQYEQSGYEWDTVLSQYGYENEDALVKEYTTSVKTQKVVTKKLMSELTNDEIQKYYDEKVYGKYTAKHILIIPATSADMSDDDKAEAEEEARIKAAEVIEKYANGESWADLVNTYSEDEGSKANEGLVENFTYGDVDDAFLKATAALKDDEYTKEPVKSQFGYHVILRVSATEKPALKSKKEEIKKSLVEDKLNSDANLFTNTLVKIRKEYKLDIKDTAIKNAYEKSING